MIITQNAPSYRQPQSAVGLTPQSSDEGDRFTETAGTVGYGAALVGLPALAGAAFGGYGVAGATLAMGAFGYLAGRSLDGNLRYTVGLGMAGLALAGSAAGAIFGGWGVAAGIAGGAGLGLYLATRS